MTRIVRRAVQAAFNRHEIVDITLAQMAQFAANILELAVPNGKLIALSTTALRCLAPAQRRALESGDFDCRGDSDH